MPWGGEKRISRTGFLTALVALALIALPAAPAGAATIAAADSAVDSNDSSTDVGVVCSIREAVMALNQGGFNAPTDLTDCTNSSADPFGTSDTVTLAQGANYTLTLDGDGENSGATGDLDVTVDMTITSTGASPPTIQENVVDTDRVLHVPGDDSLTLQSLNLQDGRLDDGAGGDVGGSIYFRGGAPGGIEETLLLDKVRVTGGFVDTTGTADRGGGIAADGGGQVTIQNASVIEENRVEPTAGSSQRGGGIYIGGAGTDLTMTGNAMTGDSVVQNNEVGRGDATGGIGGGIMVDATGDSVVSLTNTTITGNIAGTTNANPTPGFGGGFASNSGSAQITITGGINDSGSIDNNQAGGGAGNGPGSGGGVYVSGIDEALNLSGVNFSDNSAGGNGGTGQGLGGGIFTDVATVVQNNRISSNDAGVHDAIDNAINPNGFGGGIKTGNATGDLTLINSTVNDNRAGESLGTGGGIDMTSSGNLSVTGSVIRNNSAGRNYGGGIGRGGGINRAQGALLAAPNDEIALSIIRDNTVGGASLTRGGGVHAQTHGTFAIRRSTVSGNVATSNNASGAGGGLSLNGGDTGTGGGAYTVENVTIHGNTAQDTMTFAGGSGGGVNVGEAPSTDATNVLIRHSTIASNIADFPGLPGGGNLRTADGAGSVDLLASIISGGTGDPGEENCSGVAGDIDSMGFNVEGPPSVSPTSQCGLDQASDAVADPLLAGLANNGGPLAGTTLAAQEPLMTRAITTASPAFNRVTAGCPPPATDENGRSRPQGTGCDSGAFELFVALPVVNPPVISPPVTTPTTPAPKKKKKCKKKKRKGAAAAKKCKRKK